MKRALFIVVCGALIAAAPAKAIGSARSILAQLERIERQTRTTHQLDAAQRDSMGERVRELSQQFYKLPKRTHADSMEFNRISSQVWKNLREQSIDPRTRGLPRWATPRDKQFEQQLKKIEAHCSELPKPLSKFGLSRKSKDETLLQLRDDVARFIRLYPQAKRQFQEDVVIVRQYQPESQPGFYKREQAKRLLATRAYEQLQQAPVKSREVLATQTVKWLEEAKADIDRQANMKPTWPGISPFGGIDPILQEVFPKWRPGDPHPIVLPQWSPNDDGRDSKYEKVKRLVKQRHDTQHHELGKQINQTLESAWNLARLGANFEKFVGGDTTVWEKRIEEIEALARTRHFVPADRLSEPRQSRD